MESDAHPHHFNLDLLGWPKLEERRFQTRLTLFQKARLNLIYIPNDHLATKSRQTRQGGGGMTYREFSKIKSYTVRDLRLWVYQVWSIGDRVGSN